MVLYTIDFEYNDYIMIFIDRVIIYNDNDNVMTIFMISIITIISFRVQKLHLNGYSRPLLSFLKLGCIDVKLEWIFQTTATILKSLDILGNIDKYFGEIF